MRRETPLDHALVAFQNGAVLTQEELNTAVRQTLFVQQELADLYNGALSEAQVRLGSNLGIITDPDAIMDDLAASVLADEVLAEFRQRIDDIDLNAETIIQQATRLDSLNALVDALANVDLGNLSTIIQSEAAQRISGDTALAQTISLMGAKSAGQPELHPRSQPRACQARRVHGPAFRHPDGRGRQRPLADCRRAHRAHHGAGRRGRPAAGLERPPGTAESAIVSNQQVQAGINSTQAQTNTSTASVSARPRG